MWSSPWVQMLCKGSPIGFFIFLLQLEKRMMEQDVDRRGDVQVLLPWYTTQASDTQPRLSISGP